VTKSADACNYEPIHFEFDKASLTPEAQRQLSTLADCIKKANSKLTLEGHADERGTDEYNLQLSNRRAASVKKYLTDLGVNGRNLDTVGYGYHRPAVQGHNEAAWAANRRVEFKRK
jgi:peptidoglycan-associated lipoprotein